MAFVAEDFSAEGMDFKAGIYVCDYYVTMQDVVNYFAYNL
jgi:hypothetical protein